MTERVPKADPYCFLCDKHIAVDTWWAHADEHHDKLSQLRAVAEAAKALVDGVHDPVNWLALPGDAEMVALASALQAAGYTKEAK